MSLPLRRMFTGDEVPFVRPLMEADGGGSYSYVPMPYAKSCKVVLRGKSLQFYNLNCTTYPEGSVVTTFDSKAVRKSDIDRVRTAPRADEPRTFPRSTSLRGRS